MKLIERVKSIILKSSNTYRKRLKEKRDMFHRIRPLVLMLLIIICFPAYSLAMTCCQRNIGTEIIFPYDPQNKVYNDMGYIGTDSGWDQAFLNPEYGGGPTLKCPEIAIIEMNPVKAPIVPSTLDYKFSGRYEVIGDGSPPRGYTVTLKVDLIDLAHQTVVKSASATWNCIPREAGYCLKKRLEETTKLAKSFQPLDRLIYDYEAIPEKVNIKLTKEQVMLGEEILITLDQFQDASSKPSKAWQRILVKAEKGDILNGSEFGDYRFFEVGNRTVKLRYVAPTERKGNTDKIRVWNSCVIRPGQNPIPEKEIAVKEFPFVFPQLIADHFTKIEFYGLNKELIFTVSSNFRASYRLESAWESIGEFHEYYIPLSYNLLSFSGSGSYHREEVTGNCKTITEGSGSAIGAKILKEPHFLEIIYDAKSGAVQKVRFNDVGITFDVKGELTFTQICPHHSNPPGSMPYKFFLLAWGDPPRFPLLHASYEHFDTSASGNRDSGVISGGGTKDLGFLLYTIKYSLRKMAKK